MQAAAAAGRRAEDDLMPLVYDELRRIAAQQLADEPAGHTLQPTALIHEAYLRLTGGSPVEWKSRGHFFSAAAQAMRRILVDRAREKKTAKRSPSGVRVPLADDCAVRGAAPAEELLAIDEALSRLEELDDRKAKVVGLKYFAALSNQEVADALGVSLSTVKDDWRFARAWLHREMTRHG